MGNCFQSGNKHKHSNNTNTYEPFINNQNNNQNNRETNHENINIIRKLDRECELLGIEVRNLKDKNDRLEMRIVRMEQSTQNKYQELQNAVYNNNERINIITKDMEALLNNDKLLLDKLIEKNIVSTIQEENE
jgi:hypothetical protein